MSFSSVALRLYIQDKINWKLVKLFADTLTPSDVLSKICAENFFTKELFNVKLTEKFAACLTVLLFAFAMTTTVAFAAVAFVRRDSPADQYGVRVRM